MTPERLEEIRTYVATVEEYSGGLTLYEASNELLAALDAERAELDKLRGRVERFKTGIHSLSTRSLAPDRLADEIPDDPDEVSTYVLGRVGGMGCACGLWAKRDFPEFFPTNNALKD